MSTTPGIMHFVVIGVTLPVVIAQWVGILGLKKRNGTAAWKTMLTGISFTTLGSIGSLLAELSMFTKALSAIDSYAFAVIGVGSFLTLGSLLFAIGFAIHGQQASRFGERVAELETIAAAQGEELNRLRSAQGGVS